MTFEAVVAGLMAGDFSRLAPQFEPLPEGSPAPVLAWHREGRFARESEALLEAFTCACFNGCTPAVEELLSGGVDPSGGIRTGLNAMHWAANRGQLRTVELLIRNRAPLETLNAYGGTALGCAVWSARHEPKPDHVRIVEALLAAGAKVAAADFPSGLDPIDQLLRRHGARGGSQPPTSLSSCSPSTCSGSLMQTPHHPNDPAAALSTSRLLAASPHEIFTRFERPDLLAVWWGPNGFTNTFDQFEFKPGGRWIFTMHGPNGTQYPNECVFREIEPGARIVIEHVVKPWFLLTVTLAAEGDHTRLGWVQAFENPEVANQLRSVCEPSNEQVLDRLQALLRG